MRKSAVATGTTLFTALGLDTLKKQQEHYDFVKFEKAKSEPTDRIKERMEHSRKKEINAGATLVGKILPCFYPSYTFSEEGCVKHILSLVQMEVALTQQRVRQKLLWRLNAHPPKKLDHTSHPYTIKYPSITYLKYCRRWQHLEQLP